MYIAQITLRLRTLRQQSEIMQESNQLNNYNTKYNQK